MARKRNSAEQIIVELREAEVLEAKGKSLGEIARVIGTAEQTFNGKLRDELLNGEIFYTLAEARIIVERWRVHYLTIRPHTSLG